MTKPDDECARSWQAKVFNGAPNTNPLTIHHPYISALIDHLDRIGTLWSFAIHFRHDEECGIPDAQGLYFHGWCPHSGKGCLAGQIQVCITTVIGENDSQEAAASEIGRTIEGS